MKKNLSQPDFLSVPDAAKLCGVTRNTLYTWVKKGKLNAYQTPGRTNLIRPSDLVKFMEQNGMFVPEDLTMLAQQDEKMQTQHGSGKEILGDRDTILIVDDDSASRALAVRALKEEFNVLQAETGYEALHILTVEKSVKVVLLDLRMPGKHGADALIEINNMRSDISVIIVSGYVVDIPKNLIDEGVVSSVIEKPYSLEQLQQQVRDASARQEQAS